MEKIVVVTGATSGIGLETARLLAGKGYCLLAVGHSAANCEKADRDIKSGIPEADITWFAGDCRTNGRVPSGQKKDLAAGQRFHNKTDDLRFSLSTE